jgi:LuxR family transcriptional regulator, maltose regulon positive regulatory protein
MEHEGRVTTHGRAPSFIIKRPRLTKLLDESEARIILLVAPAGYGKTTLAREWISGRKGHTVWYSASAASSDVVSLAIGLAEELDAAVGDLEGTRTARLSQLAQIQQRPDVLARVVAKSRGGWPPNLLIVIDDYHQLVGSEPAEAFVSSLVHLLPSAFVITTRRRPSWFEPRREIYGEAFEIGIDELEMTDEEARAVLLASPRREAADSIARLAGGWPAVIGLAARARRDDFPEALPSKLYEFLANDLLASASPDTAETLVLLAVSGIRNRALATSLLGERVATSLEEAAQVGLISIDQDSILIHPLLVEFLVSRAGQASPQSLKELRLLAERLLELHRWDECLAIGEAVPEVDLPLVEVLGSALDEFLKTGRIATVSRWVSLARDRQVESPLLDLADGEIALRAGDYQRALALGSRAWDSTTPTTSPSVAARASLVAARAAHLMDQRPVSAIWFERTESVAPAGELRSAALHGRFLVTWEDGRVSDAGRLLQRLAQITGTSVGDQLRFAQCRQLFALSQRDVNAAMAVSNASQALLRLPAEPLARLAAINLHVWTLTYAGRYGAALAAAERMLAEADESGVEFAVNHARLAQAQALIGLRQFARATQTLNKIASIEGEPDGWFMGNTALARAFLQVSVGDLARAADELLVDPEPDQNLALHAEYDATRALISAARRSTDEAQSWLTMSETNSQQVEPFAVCAVTRAILAAQTERLEETARYFAVAVATGHHASIVLGCRAFPPMAKLLASDASHHQVLRAIFSESADTALARASGIAMPRTPRGAASLSDREFEVYELLVQGCTNRQIAATLFIAESTTKVHVRHIFEKLGVRSRVEAARAWNAN